MKRSQTYRAAAARCAKVKQGLGACEALAALGKNQDRCRGYQLANAFAELFGPTHHMEPTGIFWWHGPEEHQERILALCFMSAIVADEERQRG